MEGSESETIFDSFNLNPQLFINAALNTVDELIDGAFDHHRQEALIQLNIDGSDRAEDLTKGLDYIRSTVQSALDKRLAMWEKYCFLRCFVVPEGFSLPKDVHPYNLKMRYPAVTFRGHIVYSRTFSEVEKAAGELLKFIETKNRDGGRAVIGFDIEWKPTFRKGVKQGKVSVMQICADTARCHVMHIIHSGFPQNLRSLLGDPKSLKVGVGIAGDARKVFNDYNVSVDALEDLSWLANQKLGGEPKSWGLASLTERLMCKQVVGLSCNSSSRSGSL